MQEGAEAPALSAGPDWMETQSMCEQLQDAGQHGLLIATEHMAQLYLGWCPPSAVQVCSSPQSSAATIQNSHRTVTASSVCMQALNEILSKLM